MLVSAFTAKSTQYPRLGVSKSELRCVLEIAKIYASRLIDICSWLLPRIMPVAYLTFAADYCC
jgi:hypothetical protein